MNWLRELAARCTATSNARAYRECRRCGTAVDDAPTACPACESTEIATYSLA